MAGKENLRRTVPPELAGRRLDQAVAVLLPDYSRSRLQQWIRAGRVRVDGARVGQRTRLAGGETIDVCVEQDDRTGWGADAIPLDIVYQDAHLIVVNKPAGLVVHPGSGVRDGTLANALLHHAPELSRLPRAGIVHRLDRDTSGLLAVARSLPAHHSLVEQLQRRTVSREYEAVVSGVMTGGGTVDAPVGRHPKRRTVMAVTPGGKPAVTHYRVRERFRGNTWVRLRLETGRTHQIRVHMAHIRHPLVGDPVYGGRARVPKGATPALLDALRHFPRQALHARRLGLVHPQSGEPVQWTVAMPADLRRLIEVLHDDNA